MSNQYTNLQVNMLNVDMGMVFAFERNDDGRPQGCTGLDDPDWINNDKVSYIFFYKIQSGI